MSSNSGKNNSETGKTASLLHVKSVAKLSNPEVAAAAEVVWQYHHLGHKIPQDGCDGILCLCSSDLSVATHSAELFLAGAASWLMFSGGFGTGPHSGANLRGWELPEAEVFAREAERVGVTREKIMIEKISKNTGENVENARKLLNENNLPIPKNLIIVQKPFMERRAYATFKKIWPDGPKIFVSSPETSWEDYPESCGIDCETIVHLMVGDLQRINRYARPPYEFQIPQEIPSEIWDAYDLLVKAGFTGNLITEK